MHSTRAISEEFFDEVVALLNYNQFEEALQLVKPYLLVEEYVFLRSTWNKNEEQYEVQEISSETHNIQARKLIKRLVSQLSKDLEKHKGAGSSPLFDKPYPPCLPFAKMACNRDREMQHLFDHFKHCHDNGSPYQHFFISGQLNDRGESLIERFILEFLSPVYDVKYPTDPSDPRRLSMRTLPNVHLQLMKREVEDLLRKTFIHQVGRERLTYSLDELWLQDLPIFQKEFLIVPLKFDFSIREQDTHALVDWIMEEICKHTKPKVRVLFFYLFVVKEDVRKRSFFRKNRSYRQIERLKRRYHSCCHIFDLSPITDLDLARWFDRYSRYVYRYQQLIHQKKQEYRISGKKAQIEMATVEAMLEDIIRQEGKRYSHI